MALTAQLQVLFYIVLLVLGPHCSSGLEFLRLSFVESTMVPFGFSWPQMHCLGPGSASVFCLFKVDSFIRKGN